MTDLSNSKISTTCSWKKLKRMNTQSNSCKTNKNFSLYKQKKNEKVLILKDPLNKSSIRTGRIWLKWKILTISKYLKLILRSKDFKKTLNQWKRSMQKSWIKFKMMQNAKFRTLKRKINKTSPKSLIFL